MKTISVGVGKINKLRIKELKELKDLLLIEECNGKPLAALIPYDYYLDMQSVILWILSHSSHQMQAAEKGELPWLQLNEGTLDA